MVTKILDYQLVKSFFYYLDRFFRNLVETDKRLGSKITNLVFFITKFFNFISNLNDDFHEASFEVYYVSVSQKLVILGFSPQIFFILTSVTSDTS